MADRALASTTDQPVSWNGGINVGSTAVDWGTVQHWWPADYHYHTNYTLTSYPVRPNSVEAAFKIVGKMLEQGMIGELTVPAFVRLVNDVAEIVRTT